MQANSKTVFNLKPPQKEGILRWFSLAFDNPKTRLKERRFGRIFSNKQKNLNWEANFFSTQNNQKLFLQ